jgi:hypothetical protein
MATPFEQRIIRDVEEYGWFGLSAGPREDSDDVREWWTYTIGLPKTHGWPELIVFGLDASDGHSLIAAAIEQCEKKNVAPHKGQRLFEDTPGYHVLVGEGAAIPRSYFNSANWFAGHHGMPEPNRLQLLWPDENGRFPDDPFCSTEARQLQTPAETE